MFKTISILLISSAAAFASAAYEPVTFQWQSEMKPGQILQVRGINGKIRAEAATGSVAEVTAVKHGRHDDPAGVQIIVASDDNGYTLCAVYPNWQPSKPNSCEGTYKRSSSSDVQADFKLRLPAGVKLQGGTVNGDVSADVPASEVNLATVNGRVAIFSAASARGTTVNGSFFASLGDAAWEGTCALTTVNGSIDVNLAAGADVDIHAGTLLGRIETDFPFHVHGWLVGQWIDGTLGVGGRRLELTSVTGSIHLRRSVEQ